MQRNMLRADAGAFPAVRAAGGHMEGPDDMEEVFGDHTTDEFFEEAFVVWPGYKLAEDDYGNIIIIKDR